MGSSVYLAQLKNESVKLKTGQYTKVPKLKHKGKKKNGLGSGNQNRAFKNRANIKWFNICDTGIPEVVDKGQFRKHQLG